MSTSYPSVLKQPKILLVVLRGIALRSLFFAMVNLLFTVSKMIGYMDEQLGARELDEVLDGKKRPIPVL